MLGKFFVDTNVLVYACDRSKPNKQGTALQTLRPLAASGRGRLSAQVFGEFFRAVTRKISAPLSSGGVYSQIASLMRAWRCSPRLR